MSSESALAIVAGITLVAAATDLWTFKVYNALTFPSVLAGIAVSSIAGGLTGFGSSLLGAVVGFSVLAVFFALGGVGAGDVKLFAALGAWLGPWFTIEVFAASAVAAGVYALALVVMKGGLLTAMMDLQLLWSRMLNPSRWSRPDDRIDAEVGRSDRRSRLVPFAAMTCLGFFAVVIGHRYERDRVGYGSTRAESVATVVVDSSGNLR